jgi:hypothetical protein
LPFLPLTSLVEAGGKPLEKRILGSDRFDRLS